MLAESSLELVPQKLHGHPSVVSHAKRLQKRPSKILLDNSWHYSAMKGIDGELKRGRPDLVHISILQATSIPLYRHGKIKVYIHTVNDRVIEIGENVNIPRSFHRFAGLAEKLFRENTICADRQTLLKISRQTFPELIRDIEPSRTIGLSTEGRPESFEGIASVVTDDTCLVVGGFQKGRFSDSTLDCLDETYSVGDTSLDAHVVISRLLYECEKTIFM